MERWRGDAPARRRGWFALALLVHGVLVVTMLRSRVSHDAAAGSRPVEATILLRSLPPARIATPLPPPRAPRLRSIPHVDPDPHAIRAPVLEAPPIAQAASAPRPAASAASAPLDLTLTREQLRAVVAGGGRATLAQSLARPPAPSSLTRIGGDDTYSEKALPGGETEVHIRGSCFKMVPTPAAKADPFNHGGALPGNCN